MYCDTHMHTSFSFDSDTPAEKQVLAAIKLGIPRICITDHQDYMYPSDSQPYLVDMDRYFAELTELQDKYAGSIQIDIGIELGCQAEMTDTLSACLKAHPFDYVIGSTHFANGEDPYYDRYFEGMTNPQGFKLFFDRILENLEAFDDIDSLGHLDYVTRYGIANNGEYFWEDHKEVFEAIFRYLIRKDICLEVNTAGYKAGLGRPNPGIDVLKFYRELGGELITLGADGHRPEHVGYGYDLIGDVLTEAGFKEYQVFKNRVASAYPV